MVSRHMCCGIVGDMLMARVGLENYDTCLAMQHVGEMGFTGKAMKGTIYVSPEGIESDTDLERWVDICLEFVRGLPSKKTK